MCPPDKSTTCLGRVNRWRQPFSAFKSGAADSSLDFTSHYGSTADTSSEPVPACATKPTNQRASYQLLAILLSSVIENRLDYRGYSRRLPFWRGKSRSTE